MKALVDLNNSHVQVLLGSECTTSYTHSGSGYALAAFLTLTTRLILAGIRCIMEHADSSDESKRQ